MPRRNSKVREDNRSRAVKHAHRNATQMPQDDARNDGAPTWQRSWGKRGYGRNPRRD